jgi:hypothetical protein
MLAGSMRGASLLVLVLALALGLPAARAGDFTFTSVDDDHIAWDDAANWSGPGALPGSADDATVAAGLLRGAEVKDNRGVNSLVLDSGLNVYRGGKLTVSNGITANAGYFINDGTIVADIVNNTYIATTGNVIGNVTNNGGGAVINDGIGDDGRTGVWTGDVSNADFIVNSYGIWNGDVVSNTGFIVNENGAVWNGDVTNFADISSTSVWNGDLTNSGVAGLTGTFNGNIVNSGTVWMDGSLKGVGAIVNTGRLGLEDGAADDTLQARSLSGAGVLTVDFDPVTMTSDTVVLSGDYSADTTIDLRLLADFPALRKLGTASIVIVGGKNTGSVALADIGPSGGTGAIVYAVENSADGLLIVARPGDATIDVADVLTLTAATLGTATAAGLAPGEPCSPAASFRGVHGGATGASASIDVSGGQLGFDLACLALPRSSATLGIGLTLGVANGTVGGDTTGTVEQRFAGLYARLVADAFSAVLEGQLAGTTYRLDGTTLNGLASRLGSTASYALDLGAVTLAPELGVAISSAEASSADFGNAGAVRFDSGSTLAAHIGTTLSADLKLGEATLTPFAELSLHGDLISGGMNFIDSAGTSAALAATGRGPYAALALGANLLHAGSLSAGLRTDMKLGSNVHDAGVSGHLKVSY